MLMLSDWREELRLLRLNNPAYRPLFIVLDMVKCAAYLVAIALLVVFCWYVASPRAPVLSSSGHVYGDNTSGYTLAVASTSTESKRSVYRFDNPSTEEIPQERIDYLKSFASRMRREGKVSATVDVDSPTEDGTGDSVPGLLTNHAGVTVHAVFTPDEVEPFVIPANSPDVTAIPEKSIASPANNMVKLASVGGGLRIDDGTPVLEELELAFVQTDAADSKSLTEGDVFATALKDMPAKVLVPASSGSSQPPVTAIDMSDQASVVESQRKTTVQDGASPHNLNYKNSQWVLAQKGSHYTVQIGVTHNRPFLVRFIDTLPDDQDVALFKHKISRANRQKYVLSYGSFASFELATNALENLTKSNRRYGAYVRSFNAIQSEIKELQTVTAQASQKISGAGAAIAK